MQNRSKSKEAEQRDEEEGQMGAWSSLCLLVWLPTLSLSMQQGVAALG